MALLPSLSTRIGFASTLTKEVEPWTRAWNKKFETQRNGRDMDLSEETRIETLAFIIFEKVYIYIYFKNHNQFMIFVIVYTKVPSMS